MTQHKKKEEEKTYTSENLDGVKVISNNIFENSTPEILIELQKKTGVGY